MIITIQYYISHDTFSSKMAGNPALLDEIGFINGTVRLFTVTRFSLNLKAF